jgi:nitrite reductase/ring-hydroxylating ferredoxin subunit
MDAEPGWHDLIDWDDVKKDQNTHVDKVDGRSVFIYRSGDDCQVYDSRCPHQVTNIPHLALEGVRLTCPKHQWAFDISSGECVDKGNRPLNRFESRISKGRLEAYW